MEASQDQVKYAKKRSGKITEDEAEEMMDELRHARVRAGYSPE